ncbi:DNA sulfur modification protein DndD [Pseudomonas aeruginosa]|uniref:DNA sulfur modification protein DndD n=1 Tax=Pseudomonas aeruginosa TaxID=287 RepID=UPI003EBFE55C
MILDQLILNHFGVYRDRQVLAFGGAAEKTITLVRALNGSGKTTLLDGLRLALYGRRVLPVRSAGGYEKYLRDSIHRDIDPAIGASVSVSLRVRAEGRERAYCVTRAWSQRNGQVKEVLSVSVDGLEDIAATEAWADIIEQILPLRLSSFCFFDGEKLEDLADTDRSREAVREAISSLLGLDLVDQLSLDLKTVEKRTQSRLVEKAEQEDLEELKAAYEEADVCVRQALHVRGHAINNLERARLELAAAQSRFEQAGGDLHRDRAQLSERLRLLQQQHEQSAARLDALAHGAAPLLLLRKNIERWGSMMPAFSSDLYEILSKRDEQIIKELARLDGSVTLVNKLKAFLKSDLVSRAHASSASGRPISASLRGLSRNLEVVAEEIRGELIQHKEVVDALASVSRQLQRAPDDASISPLQKKLSETVILEAEAQAKLTSAEESLETERFKRNRLLASYTKALDKQISRQGMVGEAKLIQERTQELVSALQVFRQQVAERHAKRLAELILDCLEQLHRKKHFVRAVDVDALTFSVKLLDAEGRELQTGRLSAGERQIIAVATIWAILRLSGRPLPLVIDTPLGRLDSSHRNALIDRFFSSASHQVVLLATDTEIDEKSYGRLHPSVRRHYQIVYDGVSRGSTLSEIDCGECA